MGQLLLHAGGERNVDEVPHKKNQKRKSIGRSSGKRRRLHYPLSSNLTGGGGGSDVRKRRCRPENQQSGWGRIDAVTKHKLFSRRKEAERGIQRKVSKEKRKSKQAKRICTLQKRKEGRNS